MLIFRFIIIYKDKHEKAQSALFGLQEKCGSPKIAFKLWEEILQGTYSNNLNVT